MRTLKLIETEDGSSSLYIPELNETYHSFHGAYTESQYVFVKMGLDFYLSQHDQGEIRILEVGMGTGLNVLLTAIEARKREQRISFTTLEPFPIEQEVIDQLNFPSIEEQFSNLLKQIHDAPWSTESALTDYFILCKKKEKLEQISTDKSFDIVYFDAFAPNKQSELWTVDALRKIKDSLKLGGVLVTYCAQGQFQRNLIELGFEVERLTGPPGKKEMVRATLVN